MAGTSTPGLILIVTLEGIGVGLSVWLLGLNIMFPAVLALTALALGLKGFGTGTVVMVSHLVLGLAFAVYAIADYLFYVLQLLGAIWIWMIVNHFATPRSAPVIEGAEAV